MNPLVHRHRDSLRCLFLGLALAAATVPARAQTRLTLDQCLALAASHDPRVALAANAVRSAEAASAELHSTGLPQLELSGVALYTPVPPGWAYDQNITDGGQLLGQVIMRQQVYDGGVRSLKQAQLQLETDRAQGMRALTQKDVALAVTLAYGEALRSQEETALRRENAARAHSYEGLVRQLHQGGTASAADMMKADVQASVADLALQKALGAAAGSRLELAELICSAVDSTAIFEEPPPDPVPASADTSAIDRMPEMELLGMDVSRAALDVEIAGNERLPVISLVADAGYLSSGDNLRLHAGERQTTLGYSVGLSVAMPILNWGATAARVEQRERAKDDARLRMIQLRRSLTTEQAKAWLQIREIRTRLAALAGVAAKAEQAYVLTKSTYAGGGAPASDVFAAQQLLTDTRLDELQARADLRVLEARLKRMISIPSLESRP